MLFAEVRGTTTEGFAEVFFHTIAPALRQRRITSAAWLEGGTFNVPSDEIERHAGSHLIQAWGDVEDFGAFADVVAAVGLPVIGRAFRRLDPGEWGLSLALPHHRASVVRCEMPHNPHHIGIRGARTCKSGHVLSRNHRVRACPVCGNDWV